VSRLSKLNIKIDLIQFQSTLNLLKNSIEDFEGYTKRFRNHTRGRLDNFNSDFISIVDSLLDNMKDDMSSDMLDELRWIYAAADGILQSMKQVDDELAKSIKGASSS
jgi:hypothetical protein